MTKTEIESQIYYIYGRRSYTESLSLVDQVQINDLAGLRDIVIKKVGESGWIELIAFPAKATIQVIPRELGP